MSKYHYLGFNSLVGESIKYVAEFNGKWVALIGWGVAALKCEVRDRWIGWSYEQRNKRLKFIANNHRFLILPGINIKNLASKILAINVKRLSNDWQNMYGQKILIAETLLHINLDKC
jgi:hypothetical protein